MAEPKFRFSDNAADLMNGHCRFNITVDQDKEYKKDDYYLNEFTCVFNREKPDDADFVQPVDVRLHSNRVINGNVEEKTIECHHIHEQPIDSCIFVSPTNKLYSVPSDKYKGEDFKYHGPANGFSRGACGAEFNSDLENGQWTCILKTLNGSDEILKTKVGLMVGGELASSNNEWLKFNKK